MKDGMGFEYQPIAIFLIQEIRRGIYMYKLVIAEKPLGKVSAQ